MIIKLENITKAYPIGNRQLEILKGINMSVEQGEMLAIMGPSGSGKTTLLNLLGCLDQPTKGKYYLGGKDVSNLKRSELAEVRGKQIGFIFQNFNLLPQLSALANVELGLRYAGGGDNQLAKEALAKVGLADRARHHPSELSGGECQRVAIARALVKKVPLILADEPTGNLDSHTSAEIMSLLTDLHSEDHISTVMITHDSNVAHYCHHIIHIEDGQITAEDKL
jgi:putative ABC transport system ATP-binding protein